MFSRSRLIHVHQANMITYHCLCKRWLHQDCKHLHKTKLNWFEIWLTSFSAIHQMYITSYSYGHMVVISCIFLLWIFTRPVHMSNLPLAQCNQGIWPLDRWKIKEKSMSLHWGKPLTQYGPQTMHEIIEFIQIVIIIESDPDKWSVFDNWCILWYIMMGDFRMESLIVIWQTMIHGIHFCVIKLNIDGQYKHDWKFWFSVWLHIFNECTHFVAY